MVEQSPNVVNEERVELFGDLLLVREFECAFKRNPVTDQSESRQ
jgi:hypothetical protein